MDIEIGALRSPFDPRDHVYEHISRASTYPNAIPEELDLRRWALPVRDQGSQNTCAAISAAAMREIQDRRSDYFSDRFVYDQRANKPSSGMTGRNVFQILKKIGIIPNSMFRADMRYTRKIMKTAAMHRIANYARVKTILGVKMCLNETGPVYISLPLYSTRPEFWRPTGDEKTSMGHAVVIVGYNSAGFILRNSWGPDWNNDGHIIFPYEDWTSHIECWMGSAHELKDTPCNII